MGASSREEIDAVFDALDADMDRACALSFDALTTPERLRILVRLEKIARRLPVPGHALINRLAEQADSTELGAKLPHALADRLHITRSESRRRIAEAADLGPRRALTGEPLPPVLAARAAAQRDGNIGAGHVQVIRRFFHQLPRSVDIGTREAAVTHLAELATDFRADQIADLAHTLTNCLSPDGTYTDEDRARRRGLTLGKQDIDGMSRLSGWLTPEARATSRRYWPKRPPRAGATPRTTLPSSTAHPVTRRFNATPAAPPNATTIDSMPNA